MYVRRHLTKCAHTQQFNNTNTSAQTHKRENETTQKATQERKHLTSNIVLRICVLKYMLAFWRSYIHLKLAAWAHTDSQANNNVWFRFVKHATHRAVEALGCIAQLFASSRTM